MPRENHFGTRRHPHGPNCVCQGSARSCNEQSDVPGTCPCRQGKCVIAFRHPAIQLGKPDQNNICDPKGFPRAAILSLFFFFGLAFDLAPSEIRCPPPWNLLRAAQSVRVVNGRREMSDIRGFAGPDHDLKPFALRSWPPGCDTMSWFLGVAGNHTRLCMSKTCGASARRVSARHFSIRHQHPKPEPRRHVL